VSNSAVTLCLFLTSPLVGLASACLDAAARRISC
jgi:hypothetical protein